MSSLSSHEVLRRLLPRAIMAIATALTLAPAHAKLTGHVLLDQCMSNLTVGQSVCAAYIEGFTEAHFLSTAGGKGFFCAPVGSGPDQARKVVVKYLRKNAASLERSASELVFQALSEAWPCGR